MVVQVPLAPRLLLTIVLLAPSARQTHQEEVRGSVTPNASLAGEEDRRGEANTNTARGDSEEWRRHLEQLGRLIDDILERVSSLPGEGALLPEVAARRRSQQLRCAAFICDDAYDGVVGAVPLREGPEDDGLPAKGAIRSWLPVFTHRVGEEESLQRPGPETRAMLRAVAKDGCRMLLILMEDGARVGDLLRYGDRERELDTRANYVLLHDPALFRPEALYLWRKVVNVLFLKVHGSPPWFELTTVKFPSWGDETGSDLVDVWSRGAFLLPAQSSQPRPLFREKTHSLRGKTLGVSTFDHMPSAVRDQPSDGLEFHGVEIEILTTLGEFMDFQAQLSDVEGLSNSAGDNRTGGLAGSVARGEADIALGNLFYMPASLRHFDLSIPYTVQCQTFLTPESRLDNAWLTLVLPFQGPTWASLSAALLAGGFLFRAVAALHHRVTRAGGTGRPFATLGDAVLYSWGMLLQVPTPAVPAPWPLRALSIAWWVFCLLAAAAYRSSMTAALSAPPPRLSFDTLADLAAAPDDLICGGLGDEGRRIFSTALDEPSRRLSERFEALEGESAMPMAVASRVAGGHFAYYENEYWLRAARARYLESLEEAEEGGPPAENGVHYDLHVMRECAFTLPVSVGLATNSPLRARVDGLLRRMVETGLVTKWLADVMAPTLEAERRLKGAGEERVLMDLRRLFGALLALVAGHILAGVAFAAEVAIGRRDRRPVGDVKANLIPISNRNQVFTEDSPVASAAPTSAPVRATP
ncbi:ionotropic receptor 21a-like [Hetaerina americana]|uniref:ionotropic receptor 21a-like n=1 Tax=Hetaerina americana TaxID=62018 RepID=UPI003A7F15F0